jgi:hypothetical protein
MAFYAQKEMKFVLDTESRVARCVGERIVQNVVEPIFWLKLIRNLYLVKVAENLYYLCNFHKKLPIVNNHPIGENSPNLVTLT